MESQPQNPEFRNILKTFPLVLYKIIVSFMRFNRSCKYHYFGFNSYRKMDISRFFPYKITNLTLPQSR